MTYMTVLMTNVEFCMTGVHDIAGVLIGCVHNNAEVPLDCAKQA